MWCSVRLRRRSRLWPLSLLLLLPALVSGGNPDAKRLYDDLLSNYNKLVRPVVNVSEAVTVRLKLKLSQLIDVVSQSLLQQQQLYFNLNSMKNSKKGRTEERVTLMTLISQLRLLQTTVHTLFRLLSQLRRRKDAF